MNQSSSKKSLTDRNRVLKAHAEELIQKFREVSPEDLLAYFLNAFPGRIALASSLGYEDQAITHMLANSGKPFRIFMLDTGRLFPETYHLIDRTNLTYNTRIEVFFPDYRLVQEMVQKKGVNLFYDSVENRRECCGIRKLEPLRRAFEGLDVWICGLRREQSVTRFQTGMIEWDESNGLIKLNPIIYWTEKQLLDYIDLHKIPFNELHHKGFPSIGCQPCTRAVKPGEDIRSGRWWWETPEQKECGLHQRKNTH